MGNFRAVKEIQVSWSQNRHVDSLATLASTVTEEIPRLIKVELVKEPSIRVANDLIAARFSVTAITTLGPCWLDPIVDFLAEDRAPSDEMKASKIHRIAPRILRSWPLVFSTWGIEIARGLHIGLTLARPLVLGPLLLGLRWEHVPIHIIPEKRILLIRL
nr:hypothetical protein CFP56_06509 [Quercus suber]